MKNDIFNLLTQEYQLKLVINQNDISELKDIRSRTLLKVYEKQAHIEDVEHFLYNQDDEQSFNYILTHTASNSVVGTIRLYFLNDKTPLQQIPMQIYGKVQDIQHLVDQHPVCEISRLALARELPKHDTLSALRLRTYLTIGLFSTVSSNIFLYKYKNVFSIMEPALHRLLTRQGVDFKCIGKGVEYFGERFPHIISREKLITKTNDALLDISMFYLKELVSNPKNFIEYINNHPYLSRDDVMIEKLIDIFKTKPDVTVEELLRLT